MTCTVAATTSPTEERPVPTISRRQRERILGLAEIAELLGVGPETPQRWRYRREINGFPDPDGYVSRTVPWWFESTVERWAKATNRWPGDDTAEARLDAEELRRRALREAEEREGAAEHARARAMALQAEAERADREAEDARARAAQALALVSHG